MNSELQLKYGHFESKLRFRFKHASAARSSTGNIIVCISNAHGPAGYGEGCPRDYVTGETEDSARIFIRSVGTEFINDVRSIESLKKWIIEHKDSIDENPSAFCALEMAWLDYTAKQKNLTIEALLNLPALRQARRYTAVIGNSSVSKMRLMSWAYQLYGFSDFKVKLSGDAELDQRRLSTLPNMASVRFDANNLWIHPEHCLAFCQKIRRPFWAIEEPLQAFDTQGMSEVAIKLECKIILDESLFIKQHLDLLNGSEKSHFIGNLRVSKCGGILRSIDLAMQCRAEGIEIILGAHVGETSLLTRAALCVGQALQQPPLAREGAYGKILLTQDISKPSLRFSRKGLLKPDRYTTLASAGFGLSVIQDKINWDIPE